jgi:cytosine/adenosine deaminase-related metal-dependent hydrolase
VNVPEVQFGLAAMKDENGDFVVDALSTDGGGIPRNTMVRNGLSMARMGSLTPSELARKLSVNAARMMGLRNKGHLSPGADADVTVLDPGAGKAWMGIARGGIIMVDGVVTGTGGAALTTNRGEAAVRALGVDCVVVDSGDFLKNKKAGK